MSKFKSFASQGSFRDYQLQAPDETAKVKEQTARQIRGMDKAQAFLEENNRLYLQAQKQAQSQEAAQREQNFRLETESRRAYRDALDRDYKIQTQNDQAKAAQQQQTFKDLSQFSKTAFELYNTVDQKITENQTKANAVRAYTAGSDYQTAVAIQGLTNNLTKAEFAQQDFIRDKIAEGGSLDAYYAMYQNRNTRGFINNVAIAQNSAAAFSGASEKFLEDYVTQNPEASIEQQRLAYQTFRNEYVASFTDSNGRPLNPELLNSTVFPGIRQAENKILGEFEREIDKNREAQVRLDTFQALNTSWDAGGGVKGILDNFHTVNPSKEKRELLTQWIVGRLESGTMSADEAQGILDGQYSGPNGKQTSWREQFPTEVGAVNEAIRSNRRNIQGDYNLRQNALKRQVIESSTAIYNEVAADGSISAQDLARIEENERQSGLPGFESPVLELARTEVDSVRYDNAAKVMFDKELAAGNLTPERVMSIKGISGQLRQTYLSSATNLQSLKQSPAYKSDIDAIKAVISQDPRVKAAPVTGAKNYSVILMQERFTRQYKETLARTGSNEEARAVTLAAIKTLQDNPGSINKEGNYVEIVQQEAQLAVEGEQTLIEYQQFLDAATEPDFRTNPKKAYNAVGDSNFTKAYESMQKGGQPSAMIKNGAALVGVSPLEFINYLAEGAGKPAITVDSQIEQIQANMKPITRRLYNVNRTNERVNRANYTNSGNLDVAPTRFGGTGDRPLNSYAPQVSSIVMENEDGQPGMDIFFEDKKFPAVLGGVVKEVGWQGNQQAGYGNYVVVESIDPATNEKVDVLYAHLAMPTHFSEGSTILPGMIIGTQGGTGSVRSADGTIASIDFLAPAPKGSTSMVPYRNFRQLREQIATQLSQ